MKKLFLITLFFIFSNVSRACIPTPYQVNLDSAESTINISTKKTVIELITKFDNIDINYSKIDSLWIETEKRNVVPMGGLYSFDIYSKRPKKNIKVIVTMPNNKTITINIDFLKNPNYQKTKSIRGGC